MTDLPPEEQVVPATITCPGCGVAVAVGYPKCPRCHAAVPQPSRSSRSKRQTFREEMITGGTSLEPPGEATRSWPWLLAAAVVLAGLVVWVASRDGDKVRTVPADREAADDDEDADEDTAAGDEDDDDEVAAKPVGGGADQPAPDLGAAIRQLDGALREERLWSKVSADGDVVVIESAQCSDGAIAAVIAEHAADLGAAGATGLRCQEPHGAVVFDRGL